MAKKILLLMGVLLSLAIANEMFTAVNTAVNISRSHCYNHVAVRF